MLGLAWRYWRILSSVAALIGVGLVVVPQATNAARLYWWWNEPLETVELQLRELETDDPEELTGYHLRDRTADDYRRALERAISAADADLALSILALAEERGVPIDPNFRQRVQALPEDSLAAEVWDGIKGDPHTAAGFAAAVATDLLVIGDLRDLFHEARKVPDQDNTTVALAATGVVASAAIFASVGAATPVKVGISVLKTGKRLGKLNAKLLRSLVELTGKAVRVDALSDAARKAARLDLKASAAAAGRIVDGAVLKQLTSSGRSLGSLAKTLGPKAALDSLEVAESTRDLSRLEKLADARGPAYRGALAVTGGKILKPVRKWNKVRKTVKRAEMAWDVFAGLMGWIISALAWAGWLLLTTAKLAWRTGRFLTRPPATARLSPAL